MTIITQDGRRLDISRKYHLHSSTVLPDNGKCTLSVTTFNKVVGHFRDGSTYETGGEVVNRYGVIGEFDTRTCVLKARDALFNAWESGAEYFIVPQDTGEKSLAERFDDFCEKHGLTCVAINELGYNHFDTARNADIWRNSNDFESCNTLVADEFGEYSPNTFGGAYAKSLAKWSKLNNVTLPA